MMITINNKIKNQQPLNEDELFDLFQSILNDFNQDNTIAENDKILKTRNLYADFLQNLIIYLQAKPLTKEYRLSVIELLLAEKDLFFTHANGSNTEYYYVDKQRFTA